MGVNLWRCVPEEGMPFPKNMTMCPQDSDELLKLPLIPSAWLMYLPKELRPRSPSEKQKAAIRTILRMKINEPFHRCKGQNLAMVRKLAAQGDYRHVGKVHKPPECGVCDLCRCEAKAGEGTRGDFYGLGPETGHLGVGYCRWCEDKKRRRNDRNGKRCWTPMRPMIALKIARREVEMMQRYGTASADTEYALKVQKEEVALAKRAIHVREEISLVEKAIADFKHQLEATAPAPLHLTLAAIKSTYAAHLSDLDDITRERVIEVLQRIASDQSVMGPTEYVQGQLAAMSDKTAIMLKLRCAEVLSRLNLDTLKLDGSKYILMDYVIVLLKEIRQIHESAVRRTEELVVRKQVRGEQIETDRPICDYVLDLSKTEFDACIQRLREKVGRSA